MSDFKEYNKEDYPVLKNMYDRLEPYHYFQVYLTAQKGVTKDYVGMIKMMAKPDEFVTHRNFVRIGELAFTHKDCKIIQIDEDLMPLLEDTKPDYEELHLPYPAMFVNHQFNIGKFRINGFLLADMDEFRKMGFQIESRGEHDSHIRVLSVTLNQDGYEFYSIEPLEEFQKNAEDRKHFADNQQEYKDMIEGAKLISKLSANLITTINNNQKDIEIAYVNYSAEQNAKRVKRGKMPHRDKLVLRLGGKLKIYASLYKKARGEIQVRFFVRGHWFHFKSDRYVNKKGQKTWIYPFYKGEDKLIELHHSIVELKGE